MEFKYTLGSLPIVETLVRYRKEWLHLWVLLDIGADYTLFPRDVADRLTIPLKEGEMEILEDIGYGTVVAHKHPIEMKIADRLIKMNACFSIRDDVPENILGREELISNFKVIFRKDGFSMEPE